jgi:hypothetical protein
MNAALKVLLPIGAAVGVGATVLAITSKPAAAATPKPNERGFPPELKAKFDAALRQGDPTAMRKVADEAAAAGFKTQAGSMRAAADAVEKAANDLKPTPALPGTPSSPGIPQPSPSSPGIPQPPAPSSPSGPVIQEARVVHVLRGEGPFQMATRTKQRAPLDAARALRDFNIPFDADGVGRKSDGTGGFAPGLEPGDRLLVPPSWSAHNDITTERVGIPAGVHGDDGPPSEAVLRRLAGRVALEVASQPKGRENREIIGLYQRYMRENGLRRGDTRGIFDAETAVSLARHHAIAPPLRFACGSEIYWPAKAVKAKRKVRDVLMHLSQTDVPRSEEWAQAAANC